MLLTKERQYVEFSDFDNTYYIALDQISEAIVQFKDAPEWRVLIKLINGSEYYATGFKTRRAAKTWTKKNIVAI